MDNMNVRNKDKRMKDSRYVGIRIVSEKMMWISQRKNRHATALICRRDTSYSGFVLEGKQRLVESMALSRQ
jgi:hypothetical protein